MWILTLSHLSTHFPWNSWLQGRTRSSWRDSKSLIHTTHLWPNKNERIKEEVSDLGSAAIGVIQHVKKKLLASVRTAAQGELQCTEEEDEWLFRWYSQCLFRLMVIWVEAIGRKLFNITLGQASQFSLAKTLGEVQEGLRNDRNPQRNQRMTAVKERIKDKPRNFLLPRHLHPAQG